MNASTSKKRVVVIHGATSLHALSPFSPILVYTVYCYTVVFTTDDFKETINLIRPLSAGVVLPKLRCHGPALI